MPIAENICLKMNQAFLPELLFRAPMPVREVFLFESALHGITTYPVCPRCGVTMEREYQRFCDRCGQRLEWNELEEAEVIDKRWGE